MQDLLIEYALSWNGYLEKKSNNNLESFTNNAGFNNYTIFAKKYNEYFKENYQGQPWCAMFVSTCFYDVFQNKEIMPHFSYCPDGVNKFKKIKRWYKTPKKGDVIFFTNGLRAYHTGIVYNVDLQYVYTIEGNTSSAEGVVENGGCVTKKKYSLKYSKILGYGRPLYEKAEEIYMERLNKIIDENAKQNQMIELMGKEIEQLKINNKLLERKLNELNKTEMIYNYIDDNMPSWAREAVQFFVDNGILQGTGNGLNLSDIKLWCLTIFYRIIKKFIK